VEGTRREGAESVETLRELVYTGTPLELTAYTYPVGAMTPVDR